MGELHGELRCRAFTERGKAKSRKLRTCCRVSLHLLDRQTPLETVLEIIPCLPVTKPFGSTNLRESGSYDRQSWRSRCTLHKPIALDLIPTPKV